MNKPRLASILVTVMSVLVLSLALMAPSAAYAAGGGQISGLAFYPDPYPGVCNQLESLGASYVVRMTGDLQGCHYSFVDTSVCTPGGAYVETGHEIFIGDGDGSDTFQTTYRFTAKYHDCAHAAGEIAGRCQHPIIEGTGTGKFAGVSGRLDLRDDVVAGNFPYRGHLQY